MLYKPTVSTFDQTEKCIYIQSYLLSEIFLKIIIFKAHRVKNTRMLKKNREILVTVKPEIAK